MIYVIGSLTNPQIPEVAKALRAAGLEAWDDWHSAGPDADLEWMRYEQSRGRSYIEALAGEAAQHTFYWDLEHLDLCKAGVLVMPAGRSAHLEIGYLCGLGKPCAILLDGEVTKWDCMTQFARAGVHDNLDTLIAALKTALKS